MDGNENTGKVQNRGKDGLCNDLTVRQLDIVRHQERRGTHNGGHNLSAGGSGGLRGSRELRSIAGLFHQRNGHGTGAHGIGNGGTGHDALKGAGNHRHLGRAAGEAAHKSVGNFNEEFRNAGTLQERAKDNEYYNKLGANIDGRGEDALLAVKQVTHGIGNPPPQRRVGKAHRQGIGQEAQRHNQDGQSHTPAAHLAQGRDTYEANCNLIPCKIASLLDNGHSIKREVQEGPHTQYHKQNIIPGDVIHFLFSLPGRKYKIPQQDDQGHKSGQPQFFQPAGKQGHIQTKQRKAGKYAVDGKSGLPLPDTDIGFPVIFLHHGFQVHGLLGKRRFLFKQIHSGHLLACGNGRSIHAAAIPYYGFSFIRQWGR